MKPEIYLDYNATTPVAPEVAEAMRPYLGAVYGNPSSSHGFGRRTRQAVETARGHLADLLGCDPGEIVFTSGGTEAANLAIAGLARRAGVHGRRIVISAVEHPAVARVCADLAARHGARIDVLPVDGCGRVDPRSIEPLLAGETLLVSVMLAQNEVGTIQPVAELAARARARGVPMHTDAAQAVGKIPVRVRELGVDLLSLAGHKFYAPLGVGALYIRRGIELAPILHGAGHEGGLRPGTENVPAIVGLGEAARLAGDHLAGEAARLAALRDRLQAALAERLGPERVRLNGHPVERLPNTLSLAIDGVRAGELLARLPGVAASAGSACHAGATTISPVLAAMGVPERWATGTLRLSLGRPTTAAEVEEAAAEIARAVEAGGGP